MNIDIIFASAVRLDVSSYLYFSIHMNEDTLISPLYYIFPTPLFKFLATASYLHLQTHDKTILKVKNGDSRTNQAFNYKPCFLIYYHAIYLRLNNIVNCGLYTRFTILFIHSYLPESK